ncbi:MAG TPA: methyltransferase domain-containing protein [Actinomycetes bacterium]|nr:methyltransferase domain-containing protein [Actinomycetes bacterium]
MLVPSRVDSPARRGAVTDVVVCHTVLCHVPEPDRVLAEAFRVLRSGGPWRSATGTTPRPPWRSVRSTPFRTASRP